MLLTEWLTGRSIIRMILMGDTDRCEFGVLHKSRGHIHVIEDTERSVKWGDKLGVSVLSSRTCFRISSFAFPPLLQTLYSGGSSGN